MKQGKMYIDDLFREKGQQTFSLPAAAWDDMKLRLDKGMPKQLSPYRWMWIMISILFFTGICVYILYSNPSSITDDNQNPPAVTTAFSPSKSTAKSEEAIPIKPATKQLKTMEVDATQARKIKIRTQRTSSPFSITTQNSKSRTSNRFGIKVAKISVDTILHSTKSESLSKTNTIAKGQTTEKKGQQFSSKLNSAIHSSTAPQKERSQALLPHILPLIPTTEGASGKAPKPLTLKALSLRTVASTTMAETTTYLKKGILNHQIDISTNYNKPAFPITESEPKKSKETRAPEKEKSFSTSGLNEEKGMQSIQQRTMSAEKADSVRSAKTHTLQLKLQFGLKLGYEKGLGKAPLSKTMLAPYLTYPFNPKISISFQPTIKSVNTSRILLPGSNSFFNVTSTTVDSSTVIKNGHPFWSITYRQNYDSITISYGNKSNVIELDLPLLLFYRLTKGLYIGAGPDIAWGKLATIEEHRLVIPLSEIANFEIEKAGIHPAPDTSKSFYHSSSAYSMYLPLSDATRNPLRLGYVVSLEYERNRWQIDFQMQQVVSGLSATSLQGTKNAYNYPYLQLLLGYRLSKK